MTCHVFPQELQISLTLVAPRMSNWFKSTFDESRWTVIWNKAIVKTLGKSDFQNPILGFYLLLFALWYSCCTVLDVHVLWLTYLCYSLLSSILTFYSTLACFHNHKHGHHNQKCHLKWLLSIPKILTLQVSFVRLLNQVASQRVATSFQRSLPNALYFFEFLLSTLSIGFSILMSIREIKNFKSYFDKHLFSFVWICMNPRCVFYLHYTYSLSMQPLESWHVLIRLFSGMFWSESFPTSILTSWVRNPPYFDQAYFSAYFAIPLSFMTQTWSKSRKCSL